VDNSAEAEAASRAVGGAREVWKDDVLLVHAHQVPSVARQGGWHLALPPTTHLDQLIKIDSYESLLSRWSNLMVLGHDHPALGGHMPLG
jgi:hypothetical protein